MAPVAYLDPDTSFKHWIASDLRFYREREGMSLSQMGKVMGCNRHTVSNIEHARDAWNMNEDHADRLDAFLRLNGHFRRLVHYARTVHNPDWFADYARYETKALVIRTYRLSLFPGLFQTPDYARAMMAAARQVEDVDAAVEQRMRRQEVLTRKDPPHVWVLLDENILRRSVGDAKVMRGQLARLLEATEMPNVSIRVVLESAGYYLGLDSSFNIITLELGDVVFIKAGGGRLIRDAKEVRNHVMRWDQIGACAQPWDTSRDLIAQAMKEFE